MNYHKTKQKRDAQRYIPIFSKDTAKLLAGLILVIYISNGISKLAESQKQAQEETKHIYSVWSNEDDFGSYRTLFEAKKQAKKCGCFITDNESDKFGVVTSSKTYKIK